jgi:hypothetical protein
LEKDNGNDKKGNPITTKPTKTSKKSINVETPKLGVSATLEFSLSLPDNRPLFSYSE